MTGFAIIAKIRVRPGTRDQFKEAVLVNAKSSVAEEPACQRFDILECPEDEDIFYAYELFDDEAGFDAHRAMPHSKAFREVADDMMIEHDSYPSLLLT